MTVDVDKERDAFKRAHRHLDCSERKSEAWGQLVFDNPHVESIWYGWLAHASSQDALASKQQMCGEYTDLGVMLSHEGIWVLSMGNGFTFVEVDSTGRCWSLEPKTMTRDNELTRTGWTGAIFAMYGPFRK